MPAPAVPALQKAGEGYIEGMSKLRMALLGLVLALLFSLGLILGVLLPRLAQWVRQPVAYSTATLLQQVRTISELVTVQYVIEKVVVVEDVKWIAGLGENRVLMIAHGIVKAGMDLSQMQPGDLELSGNRLTIKLPPARITDAYLDEKQTRVVERTTGLLRFFDKDMEQTARQNAIEEIRRSARNSGILKDAEDRARAQLKHLFEPMGLQVEFK